MDDVARCFGALRADLEPISSRRSGFVPDDPQLIAAATLPGFHCGSLRGPISMMEGEHATAGAPLARLRELTAGYAPPADGCTSHEMLHRGLAELEGDTHLHVHKENNVLFPMVQVIERQLAP